MARYIPGELTTIRAWVYKHDLTLEDIHEVAEAVTW